ncbi:MAG: radical SAM protein [Thermoplasmata archaeon]
MGTKIMRTYYVWPSFPSISISGTRCALNCLHCNKKYLTPMISANTPEKFLEACLELKNKGANGILISGGCDKKGGLLNLQKFLPTIKFVKKETGFIIKLHTGFVDKKLAAKIVDAGVDIASLEVVGSDDSIQEIFGLNAKVQDYVDTLVNLEAAGIKHIAPHIAVGLHYGKLNGEFRALELIHENIHPSAIIIIVFIPTKSTELENISAPSGSDAGKVVKRAKELFPKTPIVLGAMRPRSSARNSKNGKIRYGIEKCAVDNGITGIELPSSATVDYITQRGYKIKKINAYGVLPMEYEDKVEWEWVR